jgi:hypothetical protein
MRPLPGLLPCTISYVSFAGTLPSITSARYAIRGCGWLIAAFFGLAECLYRGNMQVTTVGAGIISGLRQDETVTIPLSNEELSSITCPGSGTWRGQSGNLPTVRMRLI